MEQAKVTKNKNQINEAGRLAGENFDLQKQKKQKEAQRRVSSRISDLPPRRNHRPETG
jgi:hypothetical protein